jgi:hypothetical protein
MNERIYELFEQALKEFKQEHEYATYIVPDPIKEKFAELIVRECVAICKDIDGEDNIDARSGRQDCAVEIQEHFGVEE